MCCEIGAEYQAGTAVFVYVYAGRQTGPTWVFNPRLEGRRWLWLLAACCGGRCMLEARREFGLSGLAG